MELPGEIWWIIFTYCELPEIKSGCMVDKSSNSITKNTNFWKEIFYLNCTVYERKLEMELSKQLGTGIGREEIYSTKVKKMFQLEGLKKKKSMFSNVKQKEMQGDELVDIFNMKFVIIGDPSVGKSSLIKRYISGEYIIYSENSIGAAFFSKTVNKEVLKTPKTCEIEIWDTAGYERFKNNFPPFFYKGTSGILFCFDLSNRSTFNNLKKWIKCAKEELITLDNIVIVGCKADLKEKRQVKKEEGIEFARNENYMYYETSSKDNVNVEKPFLYLGKHATMGKIKLLTSKNNSSCSGNSKLKMNITKKIRSIFNPFKFLQKRH